ncbi:MAG: transketolase family protein, partial [Pelodictyon phaeoclathratiforme]
MEENNIGVPASPYVSRGNKATRTGFGEALLEIGREDSSVVALCADLTGSLNMNLFRDAFPDRFIQTGIAEANMISMAAGLATTGKIPIAATFAVFATGRVYDQIRQSVCYSNHNVKICASHAGLT